MVKIPIGAYGRGHDGLLDPRRMTPQQVLYRSTADVTAQQQAEASPSAGIRRLRAVFDRTFGRS